MKRGYYWEQCIYELKYIHINDHKTHCSEFIWELVIWPNRLSLRLRHQLPGWSLV